jgi:hypothetical protein
MPRRSGVRILVKVAIAAVALIGFFFLFRQSLEQVRSEPYVIQRQYTSPWTLSIESAPSATSPMLVARPPEEFGTRLFDQVFARAMESMKGSGGGAVPLVLRVEYEQALAGAYTPESLLERARAAGLDGAAFTPVCLAVRRISEPGRTRQLYYVLFESPAFIEFRAQLGRSAPATAAGRFDPASLSPVLILAGTEADFDRWLPLAADADRECQAPVDVQ